MTRKSTRSDLISIALASYQSSLSVLTGLASCGQKAGTVPCVQYNTTIFGKGTFPFLCGKLSFPPVNPLVYFFAAGLYTVEKACKGFLAATAAHRRYLSVR